MKEQILLIMGLKSLILEQ